jgi:hypothetical protein
MLCFLLSLTIKILLFIRASSKKQKNKVKLESLQIIDCTAEDGTYLRFGFLNIKNFVLQNLRLPQNAELLLSKNNS